MIYANTDNHVPEAKRNNRVIKARLRMTYYWFTYKHIPHIMIRYLVMNLTHNLNLFPTKGEVSAHYIPHIIMSQRNWDYNKNHHAELCAYIQA